MKFAMKNPKTIQRNKTIASTKKIISPERKELV